MLRLLLGHPLVQSGELEIGALTAHSSAGTLLGQHHPHLVPLVGREVLATTIENLRGHEVVFLALPHGASAEVAAELGDDVLVVDAGADHRLEDAEEWQRFYHSDHAGTWPYGLPELPGQRDVLRTTKRVAVPGCYPTTATLALMPAMAAGLITGKDVTVSAASGSSGAGKGPKPNLIGAELFGSASAYGVGGTHRHTPEILQNLRRLGAEDPSVSFTPMLVPMARGILAVCTAPLADGVTAEQVRSTYEEALADEPFVHLLPEGQWPMSQSVVGANSVLVQVTVDASVNRLVAVATLDNLTKGTGGGAVQSMNIALGLDESAGLTSVGVAP